ncbi:mitochondrial import receptor subunit tom-20 [Xylona heveae TC161]|uniref:Mitochondrial import receptor subunit TOM20 n=1 Tax=Xylona heveae (strain CBS 132557 / TC161) TaxID=1328760 RepID=A0A164ZQ88_XYLHT|nr:mitochondrial import receptor subunit tom-20 [Xylona heveae TC161]KZF19369.1 mitochondrial import receptor subunit tom-20 [Xylona heveae TC161]
MRTSTIVAASVGTAVTGFLAYAFYFDHKRRTDPEFRKALKRESKKQAKAQKEEAEAHTAREKETIKSVMKEANEEGYPANVEEKEAFFMNEVATGEARCQDGSDPIEAALCFYKALKVYPQPKDLINIYDKTVPKHILGILAEMIAADPEFKGESFFAGSDSGAGVE